MDERFHSAQAALAVGDIGKLASLFLTDPDLATSRSQRSHPTLLQCLVLMMPPVDTLEELISLLADNGADRTDPLIAASGINNIRAMTKLLDLGADIEGNGRWSPLEEALYWGNEAAVSLLIERGAQVKNLRTAAALGDLEFITRCFNDQGGLNPTAGEIAWPFFQTPIPESIRCDHRQILGNALVYASAWGRAKVVYFILDRGADVNLIPAGFDYAGTPLHYAALNGRVEMVGHLLELGADPAVLDTKIGKLAEDWAEHGGHKELSEYLRRIRQEPT